MGLKRSRTKTGRAPQSVEHGQHHGPSENGYIYKKRIQEEEKDVKKVKEGKSEKRLQIIIFE